MACPFVGRGPPRKDSYVGLEFISIMSAGWAKRQLHVEMPPCIKVAGLETVKSRLRYASDKLRAELSDLYEPMR